ncbi:hypothetical protein K2173_008559 [Erythroxylum novogranatense]|uniref:Major facilitator superfamily (MFS) profile domain-containing protein n=1 Tax=Erythroxylum novogranatense TaxID=1862640 RepID=A0AAV8SLE4_9ROSI|nr:hypothetical protein K2173_008559 [Erythroxylum novogranatense]
MAVGVAITSGGGEAYQGRVTYLLILSCGIATTAGLLFGYDIGISGGVTSMEPFLRKFFPEVYKKMKDDTNVSNYCKFDSQLLTSFTSSLYLAALVSSLLASPITRNFGRKPTILGAGFAFLAGSALNGTASNIYMLIFGRLLLGFGVGFANQSAPLYLAEMAPPGYRGAINIGFQLLVTTGVITANFINFGTQKIKAGWGWRISLAMAAIPALTLTTGSFFLLETPNSLIQRTNNHQKAKAVLQSIRGTPDVQAELDDLVKACRSDETSESPFKKILRRKYRPQLVMAIAIPVFQQLTGINVISFYAPVLFRTIGLSETVSLIMAALVAGVVGFLGTVVSMFTVDKFGRRVMFMFGGIQMLVSQVAIGCVMAAKLGDHGVLSNGYAYAVLILICVYVSGFAWSWGALGWLIPSEIFPLEIRSAGQSINVALNFLFTFIIAQTFLTMLCHFKSAIFFFFGGWVAVMTVFIYLLLPETKRIPIELIDSVWKEHPFWMRIVQEDDEKGEV